MSFKRISIIGFGNIGKFICGQLLARESSTYRINIMDPDEKVRGAILDFEHAAQFQKKHLLFYNNIEEFNHADLIFHCAGAAVPKGQSRLATCFESITITESIFKSRQFKKEPFVIVVANPVEIICTVSQKLTDLPKSNIIGTGTFLDSIRLDYYIQQLKPELSKIQSIVLGEHGASAFLSEQLSTIDSKPFDQYLTNEELEVCKEQMMKAADRIKASQDATIYGVGICALKIMDSLSSQKETLAPVSTYVEPELRLEWDIADLYLSRYAKINSMGSQPIKYALDQEEARKFKESAQLLQAALPKKYWN